MMRVLTFTEQEVEEIVGYCREHLPDGAQVGSRTLLHGTYLGIALEMPDGHRYGCVAMPGDTGRDVVKAFQFRRKALRR